VTAGYRFHVTCIDCGNPTTHVAAGTSDGNVTRAIVQCTGCGLRQMIVAALTVIGIPGHGTNNGYHAHRRRGEPACPPCEEAHATYERVRRARSRQRTMEPLPG